VRAADRDVVAGGLDLRLRVRKAERGLVEEEVGRTAGVGSKGLVAVSVVVVVVVVVVAVWETVVVVCAAFVAVGWGGYLWRSTVAAARNMGIVVVDFADVAAVAHMDHCHKPVAVDVALYRLVIVAVTVVGYSFACCQ